MGGGLVLVLVAFTLFGEASSTPNGIGPPRGQAQGPHIHSPHPLVPTERGRPRLHDPIRLSKFIRTRTPLPSSLPHSVVKNHQDEVAQLLRSVVKIYQNAWAASVL